ncbi:hypothetical protein ACIPW9_34370 [Streptomyces sp. NPDC090052]|uniref:hypothetical protein n=1 Tax=unclassified Streptomyces TaxID=2593676 RepID=UPI00225785FD|nr:MULTISPECIES: hypothetical protein [unclassified Streptomyces]MCX4726322.1 hypothetical protein [Streptomyces sp. NBC_01306]WSV04344.1 hypothetical protein OG372_12530 [Streptomyces sp. NBC_01020]WSX42415.1 hypothetical protein OG760_12260 [Streptomyces sp. NBC_00963]WSX69543.1 hypothetical protein OG221_24695 [Streptomyces sp. NBC_00932]
MTRPTAAQLSYGSATVVFSTLAMLLLSRTSSGVGVAVIVVAALVLGLLVAVTVPMPKSARRAGLTGAEESGAARTAATDATATPPDLRASAPHTPAATAERVGGHSLRG